MLQQETRTLVPQHLKALDAMLRDEICQIGREHNAMVNKNHEYLSEIQESIEARIRYELLRIENESCTKHKEASARHKSSVEEAEAKLRDEMLRVARDEDEKHAEGHQSIFNLLECEVRKLKEDVGDFFALSDNRIKELDKKYMAGCAVHASAMRCLFLSAPETKKPVRRFQEQRAVHGTFEGDEQVFQGVSG